MIILKKKINDYYTPNISQFKEGFEYEVKNRYGFSIIDFSNPKNNKETEWTTSWDKKVVPNMDPIEYPYTIENNQGLKFKIINEPWPKEDSLRTIKIMLEDGRIRAKTKK